VNYAKLLEVNSFFTLHSFLEVGKTQDLPSKFWQTLGDALIEGFFLFLQKKKQWQLGMGKCWSCSYLLTA
jgi:hypothetical protein